MNFVRDYSEINEKFKHLIDIDDLIFANEDSTEEE